MKWDKTLFSFAWREGGVCKIQQVKGEVSGLRDNVDEVEVKRLREVAGTLRLLCNLPE